MELLNYLLEKGKIAEYTRNKKTSSLEEKIRLLKENEIALKNATPPSSTSWSTLKRFNLDYALSAYPPGNKQWSEEDQEKWSKKRDEAVEELNALIAKLEEKNQNEKAKDQLKKENENKKQLDKNKDYDLKLRNILEALKEDPNNEKLKKLQKNVYTAEDSRNIDKKSFKILVDETQNNYLQLSKNNNLPNNIRIGNHITINNNNLNYDYNVVADAYEKLAEIHANYSAFLTSKLDDKNINKDDVRKYYNHIKDLNKKIADLTNAIYAKNDAVIYDKNTGEITVNIPPAQLLYVIDKINKETNDSFIELKTKDINREPWKTSFNNTMAKFEEDAKNQLQTQKNETNNIINITIESSEQSINNAQFNNKKTLEDELKKIKEEKEKLKPESSLDDLNKISAELTILHNKIYFANQEFKNKRTKVMAILKSFPQDQKNTEGQFEIENKKYKKDQLIQLLNDNQLSETSCDEIINKYENEIKPINENNENENLKKQMSDFMEEENKAINLISNNEDLFSQDIIKQAEEVEKCNKEWQSHLNAVPNATQSFFDDWKNTPALSDERGFEKKGANTHDFTLKPIKQKVKNLETLTDSINSIIDYSSKDNAEKIKAVSSNFVNNISTLPKIEDFLNRQISITNAEGEQITKTVFEISEKDLKTKLENCQQTLLLFSDKFQNKIDSINEIINLIDNDQNNVENFLQIKEKVEKLPTELQNPIKNPLDHNNISIVFDMLNAIQTIDPSITGKVGLPESIADIDRWAQKSKKILTAELNKLVYLVRKNNPSQTGQSSAEITDDASVENISGAGQEPTQANNEANNEIDEIKAILRNPNPNEAEINSLITYLQNNNNNPPDLSDPNTEVSQKDKKEIIKRIDKKIKGLKALLKIETTEYEKSSKRRDDGLADKEKHFNNIKTILNTTKELENMRSRIEASDTYTKNIYLQDKIQRKEIQEPFTKSEGRFGKKIYKFSNEQEH